MCYLITHRTLFKAMILIVNFPIMVSGINEVSETWGNMKFTVSKYMKGTQERGFVIGAVDEIVQILDDNAMNLQSMSASRFVGPFLETVNKWEKSLSHIGEVVEVKSLILK